MDTTEIRREMEARVAKRRKEIIGVDEDIRFAYIFHFVHSTTLTSLKLMAKDTEVAVKHANSMVKDSPFEFVEGEWELIETLPVEGGDMNE